jgi:hypothetical protein
MAVELVEDISELGLRIGFCFLWAGFGSLIGGPINGALLTVKYGCDQPREQSRPADTSISHCDLIPPDLFAEQATPTRTILAACAPLRPASNSSADDGKSSIERLAPKSPHAQEVL